MCETYHSIANVLAVFWLGWVMPSTAMRTLWLLAIYSASPQLATQNPLQSIQTQFLCQVAGQWIPKSFAVVPVGGQRVVC